MGSLIKHAKKIKKACIGIATGITVATMMIPPIVLSQMIMMDQEDKCSSEATGSIDVSSDGTVEENKKAQLERDKQLSEQQKQAALAKEYKAQVKQLIEMNRITIANGDIGFNFTDGNLIKKIFVDKLTQTQLINGRLAIARLLVDNNSEGEYAIIPASVADKIAQRDASSIVLHSALSAEEQDEDDPYADFKVPDDLMW